ncbi:hypothetical protein SPRG_00645 [Saprolegnia parasitica CBS 223.65]|uniref:Dynein assembly factor 1, axonemal homolog n=1 Tax=Saprolegnia parasitica (strain CBS 223.65) TaxID=695850 RepID=A0A067D6E9_SAPPC|nr:hypothetical protein SPRG_00645 [Saprolegnia parasitica CBS 223.65]KDO34582.1 hypothetical protein SPRG_00645 [Saprolegnia parasitica CBS 223.65]|eukprot:XP_012194259.1 hypothetical protein SPRG_00645 [Saprolegnia parasitica CBS 223.65]
MLEMNKESLRKICKDLDLYSTPSINDRLYLHYKGFRRIENLQEYTELKVLWLEGNGFSKIEGLENQTKLRSLFLHENLLEKIEGLGSQTLLDTLNLTQNHISKIENLSHMQALTNLSMKGNYLRTADDIRHVLELPTLAVLDIQSNRIADVDVVDILAAMPNLRVLYLQGNDVVKHIKHYRKTIISRCKELRYLDDRPVFDEERRRVTAWGRVMEETNGDVDAALEAERAELALIRQEKKDKDEANFRYFEDMMRAGKAERERRERELHDNQREAEMSPYSGEKIIHVEDCAMVRQARERRWADVVNDEAPSTPIFVDADRLKLLHDCASVGTGAVTQADAFVAENFKEKAQAKIAAFQTMEGPKGHFSSLLASAQADMAATPTPTLSSKAHTDLCELD